MCFCSGALCVCLCAGIGSRHCTDWLGHNKPLKLGAIAEHCGSKPSKRRCVRGWKETRTRPDHIVKGEGKEGRREKRRQQRNSTQQLCAQVEERICPLTGEGRERRLRDHDLGKEGPSKLRHDVFCENQILWEREADEQDEVSFCGRDELAFEFPLS